MSAGCRCGPGSGSARPDSLAAMHGSRGGTVRSTAAGYSCAGGRIAANGATIASCAPSGRRRPGRSSPRSRGRTPARCVRRHGRSALQPPSNGREARNLRREGCKSGNRRPGPRREKTVEPSLQGMVRRGQGRWKGRFLPVASPRLVRRRVRRCGSRSRGSIDRAVRRTDRKGAGGSCRSGRRSSGVRIRGRVARRSAATAAATTAAAVVATEVAAAGMTVVATGVVAAAVSWKAPLR
jgi:hypothetical protein